MENLETRNESANQEIKHVIINSSEICNTQVDKLIFHKICEHKRVYIYTEHDQYNTSVQSSFHPSVASSMLGSAVSPNPEASFVALSAAEILGHTLLVKEARESM